MSAELAAMMKSVLRVLVVEDDARYRTMLVTMLRDLSCEPAAVGSAGEALQWLDERHADALVLDLNMPRVDGLEFLARLREHDDATQVIVLTGVGTLAAAQVAIRHGVSDFLTKPCHLGALEAALDRVRRRLAQQARGNAPRPTMPHEGAPETVDETSDELGAANGPQSPAPSPSPVTGTATLADLEREAILAALRAHRGNRSAAAAALGISRRTMHYRLAEYRRSEEPPAFDRDEDDDASTSRSPA